jgi:acyl-coenzyme A synthetase/AMP-(fatty) acid ligase
MRGGKTIPLKETVDAAVSDADCVTTVLVQKRTGAHIPMGHRDVRIEEAMDKVWRLLPPPPPTHTHTRTRARACPHMHMYTHDARTHTHTHTHTHTN